MRHVKILEAGRRAAFSDDISWLAGFERCVSVASRGEPFNYYKQKTTNSDDIRLGLTMLLVNND